MAMSDVQTGQFMLAARLNSMDLDSLVVVGDEVGTVPSQASGSMKPRTMSRALARGVPSGFFDHLSNMRLVKPGQDLSISMTVVANNQKHVKTKKQQ